MLLEVDSLSYRYRIGNREVPVLDGITFAVEEGEFVAIQGPSGSGKSTLFYLLGGLLRPRSGEIRLDGQELGRLSRDGLALLRNRKVGFVFQQFHLLPGASVLENILLPCRFPLETARVTEADVARAHELARELGIFDHVAHLPNQLSGGQQQRVAIARALMRDVKLILADEPTGALDSRSAAQTMELLKGLNAMGKTVVIITHDNEIAAQCRRVLRVRDGRLESDSAPPARAARTESASAPAARPEWRGPFGLARAVIPSAFRNLVRNRAKSLLTMLGVIIGVAAVLSMITLGNFTKRRILESYENLGVNRLGVAGYPNWRLRASELVGTVFRAFDVERDLMPLKRVFPQIRLISPVLRPWRSTTVSGGGHTVSDQAEMMGVGEEHFAISNWNVAKGLPINSFHVENRSPVCLLGSELSDRLFTGTEAVGNFVTADMGGGIVIPCRVIGVLAARTSNQQWDKPNMTMMMPYSYLRVWFPQVHNVTIQAKPGTDIEKTQTSIKAYFERKYGKTGSFYVDSDAALVDQMKRFLGLFTLLLASIAALALLVGGIGINNMMLVSISERVREFGLRKALGATDRSLRFQVIGESMLLCLAAGLIGAVGGFLAYEGIIYGVSRVVPKVKFEWVFEPWAVALSAFSMVAVGLLSGLVPALKAQKLEVIEALRSE